MIIRGAGQNLRFLLPEELSQIYAYSADYKEHQLRLQSNLLSDLGEGVPQYLWEKGRDDTVNIVLTLAVGASEKIDSPEDLLRITEALCKLAYPRPGGGGGRQGMNLPDVITIQIGNWFIRKAVVVSVRVDFKKPYDLNSGAPYNAVVNLQVQYLYDKMPDNQSFSWSG
jgi:hypothetical protein